MRFVTRIASIAAAASTAGDFKSRVEAFVAQARQLAQGGLTWAEAAQLVNALIGVAVDAAEQLANTGDEKKQFVLEAVAFLYDTIAPFVVLPIWLAPFRPLIRSILRPLVLNLADGAIEAIVSRLKPARLTPAPQ
jgi:hypothetical protein